MEALDLTSGFLRSASVQRHTIYQEARMQVVNMQHIWLGSKRNKIKRV
jgi:hypothetical protein